MNTDFIREKTVEDLQRENEMLLAALRERDAQLDDVHAELESMHGDLVENRASLQITAQRLQLATEEAVTLRNELLQWRPGETELSVSERARLHGTGVRRFGFISKVTEMMIVNSEFIPSFLNREQLVRQLEYFEAVRNLNVVMQQVTRLNADVMLILGDSIFRMALMYYGAVRDAANRGAPGARELFRILQQFFRRGRRTDDEPTEEEVFKHIRSLLHKHREGEIVVKNEGDRVIHGKSLVIDDSHLPAKERFRESAEGEINN